MKAKDLKPGQRFMLGPNYKPDPEGTVRVCLTNDPVKGLRFGFPSKPGYWCYMGEEVDVVKLLPLWCERPDTCTGAADCVEAVCGNGSCGPLR